MKIVILGGTGLIGEALKQNFKLNHEVQCIGREAFISFETLFITGLVYVLLIPISFFHHRYLNKKSVIFSREDEETEDEL